MELVNHRQDRDSHDLSYLATRFSVVDSMLSSLSGFPSASYPDGDDDFYTTVAKRTTPSNTGRRRGHTQSSSVDNYEIDIDDLSSRYSDYHSRGRMNGAVNLPRRSSRDTSRHNSILKRPSIDVREQQGIDGGMARHTRGTPVKGSKGSKGSGSSSLDMSYSNGPPPTTRYSHGPSRAASFDHSYTDRVPRSSPPRMLSTQNLVKSTTQPIFDYVNLDAAPTPTVPAGPRRPEEPLSPHLVSQPPPPKPSAPSRKNSIRSTTSKVGRRPKSNTTDSMMRDQAQQFVQESNIMRTGMYAVNGPAPSPTVGGPRRQHLPPAAAINPPKERPGFFRRLFGSDKANDEYRRPPSPPPLPNVPISTMKRPATQGNPQHIASQMKSSSRPSTQDAPPSSRESAAPPTLKKSHSSFFRRRKKSISEPAPPVPPLQLQTQPQRQLQLRQSQPNLATLSVNAPQISPSVSSLRKVMDPYLTDNQLQSPDQVFFDSREHQNEDSNRAAENGPLSSTVARSVVPVPDREVAAQDANGQPKDADIAEKSSHLQDEPSQPRAKVQRIRLLDNDGSFLADSSGNESMGSGDSPHGPSPPEFGEAHKIPRSAPAPTSSPYNAAYSYSSKENIPPPTRAAPTIQQKPSLQVLSPISDRSQEARLPSPPPDDVGDDDEYGLQSNMATEGSLMSHASNRVWLEPSSSEERVAESTRLKLPLEGPRTSERPSPASDQLPSPTSDGDVFASATSLPIVQVGAQDMQEIWPDLDGAKAILAGDTDPTSADRERARQIFEGEEDFVTKAEAAAWLGQNSSKASRTRRAYMELYDWAGYNILAAFRELCGRLVVKAESQQLDRVIDAFSERWCSCNPSHGFKDRDVVHTITYSVLMLNTDLHIADLDQRMTRSQFVKNTLPTIRSIAEAAAAESHRKQSVQGRTTLLLENPSSPTSPVFPIEGRASEDRVDRPSLDTKRSRNRLSVRPPVRQDSDGPEGAPSDNCNVLVNAPFTGGVKGWESLVEIVLKEFYNSIRAQRLPLHGAPTQQMQEQSSNSLAVVANALRRTPSVLSKAPSDTVSYRGRGTGFKAATERFANRRPSRPRVYPTSTVGSSRTSLDDQSVFSPAGSTWSKYSLGKTQTSLSVDSFGSHLAHSDYQQAIGFANALSQAIIREEAGSMGAGSGSAGANGSEQEFGRSMPLLEDESLELVGAPWAKEGMVKHRHHLESLKKKAMDRGWNECFAVIEKGWMRLFSFNPSKSTSKSILRQRAKSKSSSSTGAGTVVGGGNWTEKAESLSQFLLRQTIATALPSPGFSNSRPHVFALSLPTGAVHLFSVGTAEIVKEFVSTANYWSARLSKEPLIGGVSNVEYGWSDSLLSAAAAHNQSRTTSPTPGSAHGNNSATSPMFPRSSVVSPLQSPPATSTTFGRSSFDQSTGREAKGRYPGDKVQIADWSPPVQSMMASNLMEIDQLKALTNYVANVEEELKRHNELRSLMGSAYSHRNPNAARAMANWEKKSAYLLREIVKFRTYIDSLGSAAQKREEIYRERDGPALPQPYEKHDGDDAVADAPANGDVQRAERGRVEAGGQREVPGVEGANDEDADGGRGVDEP